MLLEAAVLGLVASALGVAAGVGLAAGMDALLSAFDVPRLRRARPSPRRPC